MRTRFDHDTHLRSKLLAELKEKTTQLERQLSDTRASLEREFTGPAGDGDTGGEWVLPPEGRTQILVNQGRRSARGPGLTRRAKVAGGAVSFVVLIIVIAVLLASGGPSWPASVTKVQSEIATACQNPDVRSEPGQVNFACAPSTRQILWVFALLTSDNNPGYRNTQTGRQGLEPITPVQGGEIAWSLNLHHPYNPANPIDSLEVAARAINNIIGGVTLTGASGAPAVQSGLESHRQNCLRYTGSVAVVSRAGFPRMCAKPVTSAAGQALLVADIYQKWMVGATPQAAQNAAVLFQNAKNPGNPQVQAILRHLPQTSQT